MTGTSILMHLLPRKFLPGPAQVLRRGYDLVVQVAPPAGRGPTCAARASRWRGARWRDTETDTSYYASPASPFFGPPEYGIRRPPSGKRHRRGWDEQSPSCFQTPGIEPGQAIAGSADTAEPLHGRGPVLPPLHPWPDHQAVRIVHPETAVLPGTGHGVAGRGQLRGH